jgi:hypothetical protein
MQFAFSIFRSVFFTITFLVFLPFPWRTQLTLVSHSGISVVSGARPAFEDQAPPDDSGESTDESDDDDPPRNELSMRLSTIVDLVKKLYELGFKIRDPRLRPSSKASLYREVDPETAVDLFNAFAEFDQKHVDALLHSLRQGRGLIISTTGASDYLVPRLVASITLRRKNFRYWEKHGKKLSLHSAPRIELATDKSQPASQEQSQG